LGTNLKFWELGGFFQEGRRWLQPALDATQTSVSIQRAQSLLAAEECRDIYQSLVYRRGVATTLQNLGGEAFDQGDYTRARTLLCEALRMRRELGLPRGYAYSFEFIADLDEAENVTNTQFNCWQQLMPCGFASARANRENQQNNKRGCPGAITHPAWRCGI